MKWCFKKDINAKKIQVNLKGLDCTVKADPAEIETIFINLISNSTYWLGKTSGNRIIEIHAKIISNNRVKIGFHDSGPGISHEDLNKVLLPGITRKPDGIGMGLTVVSELINSYNGNVAIITPPKLGGASFVFDLPLKESR
ncbi:MAG: HAMP domain-containing histidine kinase [Spirochaetes bacterium]|nr:HAMP domain-containing histidine kinase [Spirochaetota bacterium]